LRPMLRLCGSRWQQVLEQACFTGMMAGYAGYEWCSILYRLSFLKSAWCTQVAAMPGDHVFNTIDRPEPNRVSAALAPNDVGRKETPWNCL
jgi:hypothetical protein